MNKVVRVMYDDDRFRVGNYQRGKVYEVDENEAERLIKNKGFIMAADAASTQKVTISEAAGHGEEDEVFTKNEGRPAGMGAPTTDRMVRNINTQEKADEV